MFAEGIKVEDLKPGDLSNVLDRWITSKTERMKDEITEAYNNYDLIEANKPLEDFINILSTWYLRRSRERFKGENSREKIKALKTLRRVLFHLSQIMAPVMPFIAEHIYQELNGRLESVHLEGWSEVNKKLIDKKLEEKMEKVRGICSAVLQKRAEAGIRVRQPLLELKIKNKTLKTDKELIELIKDEVNVKGIAFDPKIKEEIILNTQITKELEEEGMIREFTRQIQAERKKAGLTPKDKIKVCFGDSKIKEIVEKNKEKIKKQVIAEDVVFLEGGLKIEKL